MRPPPNPPGRRAATLSIIGLALGAATLGGCVVAPAYPRYPGAGGYGGGYDDGVVTSAPPAPRYEVIGVAPQPGWFWISGFWTWHSHRHHWVEGRWQAPRHGYRWQPHRWEPVNGGRGWRERPGRWN